MENTLTMEELDAGVRDNGQPITPADIWGPEETKPEDLLRLLDKMEDTPVEQLPPPPGVSPDVVAAVQEPAPDPNVYAYADLIDRIAAEPPVEKVPTGLLDFDNTIDGGLEPGELVVVSAATKQGKSTLCQTMSYIQAENNIPTLWFSLEMSWRELMKKFAAMDSMRIITGKRSVLPIYSPIETKNISIPWLEERIVSAQQRYGIKAAYIDHLHFLISLGGVNKNVSLYVGQIMRELKQLAVRRAIPIILIAHTGKLKNDEIPDISAPRDSSFVVQEADFLLVLWRERRQADKAGKPWQAVRVDENPYTGVTWVSIEANRRNGNNKRWRMGFINGRFHDWDAYMAVTAGIQQQHYNAGESIE